MPISSVALERQIPVGADFMPHADKTQFRVWAPKRRAVRVVFKDGPPALRLSEEGDDGYFSGCAAGVKPGDQYKYRIDEEEPYPDPASRYQPEGPHGWSQIVDPNAFSWSDQNWRGVNLAGQVIYEMHLGTFTPQGTWKSASEKITYLGDTGITIVEVMPVAEFAGKFGWGYDGVQPYAPASIYGTPDDMRRFVDKAHAAGIGVILDVVYNHLGPDGNYLPKFSPFYFSDGNATDWGEALNYDGKRSGPVREYFRENAAYWIREFHLDGLRLDATQDIHDDSEPHIITEIGQAAREAAGERKIILVGENEPQNTRLIRPFSEGGYGLDALWNDDFHHTAVVALTGKSDAYYSDYGGTPQEFLSALKYGYLYQGQMYRWQKKRRGSASLNAPRPAFVTFIENHDQVANSARGQRLSELASPGLLKAVVAVTLLGPGTPMLFQGQEFGSTNPFLFFAGHKKELAESVRKGRIEFLEQWRALRNSDMQACFADPGAEETFRRSKLDFSQLENHRDTYALYRDLLKLRRDDPVISQQGRYGLDGAVLSNSAFVVRYFSEGFEADRLLVVNFGKELELNPAPEPLLAPPACTRWDKLWSSEDPAYNGCGTAPLDSEENWRIPGRAAVVLHPVKEEVCGAMAPA